MARKSSVALGECLLAYQRQDGDSVDAQVGARITAEWMLSQMKR